MNVFHRVYQKCYYYLADRFLNEETLPLPEELRKSKNVFLYYDYEREFSGHKTEISDSDIEILLAELDRYKMKATWFTIGKLFEGYPVSIEDIIKRGHEIGSHTYGHFSILFAAEQAIDKDFVMYQKVSDPFTVVRGFHSPRHKWSFAGLKLAKKHGFLYDVALAGNNRTPSVKLVKAGLSDSYIRVYTVGDDWSLFNGKPSEDESFDFYKGLYENLKPGEVGGIGSHPWILFSNKNILKGYRRFLGFLSEQKDARINTALYFVQQAMQEFKNDPS